MTSQQGKAEESLDCSHCESLGEISLTDLQRKQKSMPTKVWVRNLPEGISESGVKNLFLTVGEPLSLSFNPKSRTALVEFKLMKEVDLAIRDLHCKPPYNLKVTMARPKIGAETPIQSPDEEKLTEMFAYATQLGPGAMDDYPQQKNLGKLRDEQLEKKFKEAEQKIIDAVLSANVDYSLRMRQEKLDFKTDSKCVSKGRGYLYMGGRETFIGGLEKFQCSSENSRAKDKMSFSCENCAALTTKICGDCSTSFCSKVCATTTTTVDRHMRCLERCLDAKGSAGDALVADMVKHSPRELFPVVSLKSGCTVVMSYYFTIPTVFVRPCDNPWEEKFKRLCNEVAVEALRGTRLEKIPNFRELVIARYYEDQCFYRGQFVSIGVNCVNSINIFFIDFGNIQKTRLEDMMLLPSHLKCLPGLAVKVKLKGVSLFSSIDVVNYYNRLTSESTPLTLNLDESADEAILVERDSKTNVNETAFELTLPSWKKDSSAFSKTGEVFYLSSMKWHRLEVGKTCKVTVSHFDEKEFAESEVFWVVEEKTDESYHASTEMLLRMTQYCELLREDFYLPRTNEVCLARENGRWHRCVNLQSHKTTCCLFFVDDGHSSYIATSNIRKMVRDFTELPLQAVCCTLPEYPKLKGNRKFEENVVDFLQRALGNRLKRVTVLKVMGDAYCLSIPDVECISSAIQNDTFWN